MENKWKRGWKFFGLSLMIIVIPGSTFLLPFLLYKPKKNKFDKSNQILGI